MDQNSSLKSLSIENNRVSPDVLADLFEAAASPNNGLIEMRVAAQQQEKMGQRVEERIAAAICKNPRYLSSKQYYQTYTQSLHYKSREATKVSRQNLTSIFIHLLILNIDLIEALPCLCLLDTINTTRSCWIIYILDTATLLSGL